MSDRKLPRDIDIKEGTRPPGPPIPPKEGKGIEPSQPPIPPPDKK